MSYSKDPREDHLNKFENLILYKSNSVYNGEDKKEEENYPNKNIDQNTNICDNDNFKIIQEFNSNYNQKIDENVLTVNNILASSSKKHRTKEDLILNSNIENEKYFYTFKTANSTARTGGNLAKINSVISENNAYINSNNGANYDIVDYDDNLDNCNRENTNCTFALNGVKRKLADEREREKNFDNDKDKDKILKPFRSNKNNCDSLKNVKNQSRNNLQRNNSRYDNMDILDHNYIIEENITKSYDNVQNTIDLNYDKFDIDNENKSYTRDSNCNEYNSNKILMRKNSILNKLKIRSDEHLLSQSNTNPKHNFNTNTERNTFIDSKNLTTNDNTQNVKENQILKSHTYYNKVSPSFDFKPTQNNKIPQAKETNILLYNSYYSSTVGTPNALPRVIPNGSEIEKENQNPQKIEELGKETFLNKEGLVEPKQNKQHMYAENGSVVDKQKTKVKENINRLNNSYKDNITGIFAHNKELLNNSGNSNYAKKILMTSFDVVETSPCNPINVFSSDNKLNKLSLYKYGHLFGDVIRIPKFRHSNKYISRFDDNGDIINLKSSRNTSFRKDQMSDYNGANDSLLKLSLDQSLFKEVKDWRHDKEILIEENENFV